MEILLKNWPGAFRLNRKRRPLVRCREFDAGVCASDPSWFARIAVYMQFAAVAVIAATCTLEAVERFFCLQEQMPVLSYRLQPVL